MDFPKNIGRSAGNRLLQLKMAFLIWAYNVVPEILASAAGVVAAAVMIRASIGAIGTVIKVVHAVL